MKYFLTACLLFGFFSVEAQLPEEELAFKTAGFDIRYNVTRFKNGSIMSFPTHPETDVEWILATAENPEQMKAVFYCASFVSEIDTDTIPVLKRYDEDLFKKSVVTDNIAHVRYNLQNGPIQKGDYITISSEPGVGMKATESGFTIGVALENSDTTEKPGLIKVRVMVRYERF